MPLRTVVTEQTSQAGSTTATTITDLLKESEPISKMYDTHITISSGDTTTLPDHHNRGIYKWKCAQTSV